MQDEIDEIDEYTPFNEWQYSTFGYQSRIINVDPPIQYKDIIPFIEDGLISEQKHPQDENLRIFNYTQKCQFAKKWNKITTRCRGLIIDISTNKIKANPFPKIFNYQEWIDMGKKIPTDRPIIRQKFDGSLGILYWINDIPYIATRGSFTSDQALWATKWFWENVKWESLNREYTYLFEIIYPENRIVINYNFSGLVLLAVRKTYYYDNPDINIDRLEFPVLTKDCKKIKKAEVIKKNIKKILQENIDNEEGVVLYYEDGLRLKIKYPEYVRLHKLMTNISETSIWEILKDEKSVDVLFDKVPDEFFNWIKSVESDLKSKYFNIESISLAQFENINYFAGLNYDRKYWAEKIQTMTYPHIGFAMLDKKPYNEFIWKLIKPKYLKKNEFN